MRACAECGKLLGHEPWCQVRVGGSPQAHAARARRGDGRKNAEHDARTEQFKKDQARKNEEERLRRVRKALGKRRSYDFLWHEIPEGCKSRKLPDGSYQIVTDPDFKPPKLD